MQVALKVLAYVGTVAGFVGSLNAIPGVSSEVGTTILFASILLKDTVNRVGDFLDDGQVNQSFPPKA